MKIKVATKRYLALLTETRSLPKSAEAQVDRNMDLIAAERERFDRDKAATALAQVNGNAGQHTVGALDLLALVQDAEARLAKAGILKARQGGTVLTYVPAAPNASSYKYSVISTRVELTRGSSGDWFLTAAQRVNLYPRTAEVSTLTISEAAQADVIATAMAGFALAPAVAQAA